MTRLLAAASAVALIAAWLVVIAASPANAGKRYCGPGHVYSVTTVTRYVGPAWNRPGWRLMSTRRLWSATSSYYVCTR